MPKTKLGEQYSREDPPIDWLHAAVLERMYVLGYDLKRMSEVAGVHYATMRRYIRQSPWTWDADARAAILREFGLKTQVSVVPDESPKIQLRRDRRPSE